MLAPLVFVLALSGILLLVVGERMGLSTSLSAEVAYGMLALAVAALGIGSVTSRFERFATGARTGRERIGRLSARVSVLMVLVLGFVPGLGQPVGLWGGFILGFLLAHLGQGASEAGMLARMARLLAALAMGLLLLAVLPSLWDALARLTALPLPSVKLLMVVLAALVLLPGGAIGVGHVQRVMLALVLALALLPLLALLGLSAVERGDPLLLESAMLLTRPSVPAAVALNAVPPGAFMGMAAGLAARGHAEMRLVPALGGLFIGLLLTGLLVGVHALAQDWLARIIGTRILAVAPQQWPAFVFDDEIRGWLRACGQSVQDPAAAARACGTPTAAMALKEQDVSFMPSLASAALARAAGLPLTLGNLWLLMPALLGFAGLLSLLKAIALALSEAFLFRTLNPSGLRSWRLAMARLMALVVIGGAMGWAMVASGLVDRPAVSHYRLAAHLLLAIVLYAYTVWLVLELSPRPVRRDAPATRRWASVLIGLLLVTLCWGALVAGLRAGSAHNTFPTMSGHWLPPGLLELAPAWINPFENPTTVQFVHRWLAKLLVLAVLVLAWRTRRPETTLAGAMALLQLGLGIATILSGVDIALATMHQAGAVLLLTLLVVVRHRATPSRPGSVSATLAG